VSVIVVLDTNVWVSDLALTSNVGSAVRFFLRERKARIGLPEVVRLETEIHLRSALLKHIDDIRSSHRQLLSVFGRLKEVVLPNEAEVSELIAKVFTNLGVEIEDVPFSLESAKNSLARTIEKIPPSDKNQQFKDGVLWADCLSMLKKEPVHLVTNDGAFYKSRDIKQGLADELRREVNRFDNRLEIFPSLTDLLSQIRTNIQVDAASLLDQYWQIQGQKIQEMSEKHSFALEGVPRATIEPLVTEKPTSLFVSFSIEYLCADSTNEGRIGARILARGEGTYDTETGKFVEMSTRGEKLSYQLPDGTEKQVQNVVAVAGSIVIGHRTVEHSVRYKL
jgi:hypothetical protein